MRSWLDRKLSQKCARAGCDVLLPDDAEHCLCDAHAEEHRFRNRQAYQFKKHQLVLPLSCCPVLESD